MFIKECFIRKNTYELVEKLKELGYIPGFSARNNYGNSLQTDCHKSIGMVYGYHDRIDDNSDDAVLGVNCGTNEELLLAIAALRDDSDKHQWFTNDVFWIKCSQIDLKHDLDNNYEEFCVADFHKATVEELIKHFTV